MTGTEGEDDFETLFGAVGPRGSSRLTRRVHLVEGETYTGIEVGEVVRRYGQDGHRLLVRGCSFENSRVHNLWLSGEESPRDRPLIQDCSVVRCRANALLQCFHFVDLYVADMARQSRVMLDRAALRHVTLTGCAGHLIVYGSSILGNTSDDDLMRAAEQRDWYANCDWALDIRMAQFRDADLSDVPGRLVRYLPKQCLRVEKDRLEPAFVEGLREDYPWAHERMSNYLKSQWSSLILPIPRLHFNIETILKEIAYLKSKRILRVVNP